MLWVDIKFRRMNNKLKINRGIKTREQAREIKNKKKKPIVITYIILFRIIYYNIIYYNNN